MTPFCEKLAQEIASIDFSGFAVTVVGYGNMGKQYVKALRALGVKKIRVCSRSENSLKELKGIPDISVFSGGYQQFKEEILNEEELAIIATPTDELISAVYHLREIGFRHFLIEKPLSFWSDEIRQFIKNFDGPGINAACAYNRVSYPSLLQAREFAEQEGGITSCTYTFTEFIHKLDPAKYTPDEMMRWGVANSLHVMSMAHGLIGLPQKWNTHISGSAVVWHPTGSVFVGSGISEREIPFTYHADWGSTGRWSVEIHTKKSSYRCCPLEKLYQRTSATTDWVEIPMKCFSPEVKVGFVEQVAAMLHPRIRQYVPFFSLQETLALTLFGEDVFKYASKKLYER